MKPDLRTKAGRRAEVIAWVREHGSLSAFWISENHLRAVVVTEMIRSGELVTRNTRFPFMTARLDPVNAARQPAPLPVAKADAEGYFHRRVINSEKQLTHGGSARLSVTAKRHHERNAFHPLNQRTPQHFGPRRFYFRP